MRNMRPHIKLDDFLKKSPHDLGPIAFFKAFDLQATKKHLWNSVYITLYTQALRSEQPNVHGVGDTMKKRWAEDKAAVAAYWGHDELRSLRVCSLIKNEAPGSLEWVWLLTLPYFPNVSADPSHGLPVGLLGSTTQWRPTNLKGLSDEKTDTVPIHQKTFCDAGDTGQSRTTTSSNKRDRKGNEG